MFAYTRLIIFISYGHLRMDSTWFNIVRGLRFIFHFRYGDAIYTGAHVCNMVVQNRENKSDLVCKCDKKETE